MMSIFQILISFLTLAGGILPQTPSVEFERIESHGITFTIFEDERGFVWAGTSNSLLRYDGVRFVPYETYGPDAPLMETTEVISAYRLSQDKYLFGNTYGLISFDTRTARAEKLSLLDGHDVRAINSFGRDSLLVGTTSGVYVCKNGEASLIEGIGSRQCFQIHKYSSSEFLICMYSGLFRYNWQTGSVTKINIPFSSRGRGISICQDKFRDCIWIGIRGKLIKWTPSNDTFESADLPELDYKYLLLTYDGEIWGSTEGGLFQYNPERGFFRVHRHDAKDGTSLHNGFVWSLFEDDRHNLWVGTNDGVSLYRRDEYYRKYRWVDFAGTAVDNRIISIREDEDGRVWMGGDAGLVCMSDFGPVYYHKNSPEHPIANNVVRDIHSDKDGNLWLATDGGLCYYNERGGSFENYILSDGKGHLSHWCYHIMHDKEDNIWVSSYDGGIFVVPKHSLISSKNRIVQAQRAYSTLNGLPDNAVKVTVEAASGEVWALLMKGWLARISGDDIRLFSDFDGRNIVASNIVMDDASCLWVSVRGGIVKFDTVTEEYEFYAVESPQPLNPLCLKDGLLWASASDRVFIIGRDRQEVIMLDSYGYSCGELIGNELLIGGYGKILLLPTEEYSYDPGAGLSLLSLRSGGEKILVDKQYDSRVILEEDVDYVNQVTLPWSRRYVEIDLYSPCPEKIEYRLSDDQSWISLVPVPYTIHLPNLGIGTHTIFFRDKFSGVQLREFTVKVLAPWYARWYMITIYVFLFALMIFLLTTLYVTNGHLQVETAQKEFYIRQSEQNEKQLEILRKLSAPSFPDDGADTMLMKALNSYLNAHIEESDISIQKLADEMKLPPKQLYRKVKSASGLTVVEYVRSIRLQKAAELLKTGEFNVTETMYKVGFSNLSYFTKCFIGLYGVSPKKFQE